MPVVLHSVIWSGLFRDFITFIVVYSVVCLLLLMYTIFCLVYTKFFIDVVTVILVTISVGCGIWAGMMLTVPFLFVVIVPDTLLFIVSIIPLFPVFDDCIHY